jgi:hypothetical protein
MILVNEGMIIATGTNSLEIDTGANTIVNSGTLEATGSGGLVIDSNLENSGLLWANGANITFHGSVTGSGTALMDGAATIEFGAASSMNVTLMPKLQERLSLATPSTLAELFRDLTRVTTWISSMPISEQAPA